MASVKLLLSKRFEMKIAIRKTGIPQRWWCETQAYVSPSTLKRFLKGDKISIDNFRSIVEALGIEEWKAYVDWGDENDSTQVVSLPQHPIFECPPTGSDRSNPCVGFFASGGINPSDLQAIEVVIDRLKGTLLKCNVTISQAEESSTHSEETIVSQQLVVTGSFTESDRRKAIALLEHLTTLLLECEFEVW
jgi:NAD-dependent DNA ligase